MVEEKEMWAYVIVKDRRWKKRHMGLCDCRREEKEMWAYVIMRLICFFWA